MKHLANRRNFQLLFEQAIFSVFNFIVIISLYNNISIIEVAAMGVNITALYGAVSICRNLVSGEFTQSRFPNEAIKIESVLRKVCVRVFSVVPVVTIIISISCYMTNTSLETTILLLLISVEVLLVDNLRQIQILYLNLRFMIVNLMSSIVFTYILMFSLKPESQKVLMFWLFTFLFYSIFAILKYFKIFKSKNEEILIISDFVSRKSITLESFSNHSLFYLYNLIFFQINPLLSGDNRLITAWIVNAASSLYITLNNYYTIRLVNYNSTYQEQKSINYLAFLTLVLTSFTFLIFHSFIPFSNIKIDAWLIFGSCVSSLTFFIHSRISVLYLHAIPFRQFLTLRTLTWIITLSMQLFGLYFFDKTGFIVGSILSFLYVFDGYQRALAATKMLKDSTD